MRIAVAALLFPAALFAAPIHYQPMRPQYSSHANTGAAPAGAWLNYYGGKVISNVHVVPVLWGPNVPSQVSSNIANFYSAAVDSGLMDLMTQYDTNVLAFGGAQGTNQHIARGTSDAARVITPSITSTSITNDQIWQELQRQATAGSLPSPDGNTLYMVHFPAGMSISMPDGSGGTAKSCQQFCAYHNTVAAQSPAGSAGFPEFYYGVIPNVTSDGCELGCGPSGGGFNNTTSVASHELIEAITDAEVGLAQDYAPPLAWYDPQGQNGEIGDICNGAQGTISSHGQTWTIQQEFSNAHDACVTEPSSNDYAVRIEPGNRAIAAGSSATYTVTAKTLTGTVGTISLSASGFPSGLSGSFATTQLSPGQSTTLTVSASSSATNGDNYLTITGSAGGASRTAKAEANVSGGQAGGGGGGGGCPAGTIDLGGGICLPIGCNSTSGGVTWLGAFAVGAFMLWRRRAQK
jgi:MYXO-CTERM domain-containing protein